MGYIIMIIGCVILEETIKINCFGICLIGFAIIYTIRNSK